MCNHHSRTCPPSSQAAALAVSSAQHQTPPPPPQQTYGGATPGTPPNGSTSAVETSTAASINSVLPENAAPNGVGPVASQATGRAELPAVATPLRLKAAMLEPPAIEKEPTGAVGNGALLPESAEISETVPPPSRPAEVSAEQKRNKADESGPWAFAQAPSDSGEQVKPQRLLVKRKNELFPEPSVCFAIGLKRT